MLETYKAFRLYRFFLAKRRRVEGGEENLHSLNSSYFTQGGSDEEIEERYDNDVLRLAIAKRKLLKTSQEG